MLFYRILSELRDSSDGVRRHKRFSRKRFGYSGLFIVMNLLPKDDKFFELFEKHSAILCRASSLLLTGLAEGYEGVCRIEKEMKKLEDDGDQVIHEIFGRLRSTFITPLDPEDIQALATSLDDVLDGIEDVTFRIVAYQLNPIPHSVTLLAEMIYGSCGFLAKALDALHRKKPVIDFCIEVNRLEDDADHIERNQIAALFRTVTDPIDLIRQKEIVELLEATTDRCEDAADVMQNVAVKHS